ncbi:MULTISPECIES: transglycosylase domain-containing protein [Bradyrhizobium]|uniref:transglycosylase domain-containing protein n=1 Tax=Bradyrhizobium centrosematis TaxID=1300039 RepID=UPI00216A6ECC|nr:transglycosylase domain-containing protein [Bradyrhizobium centrosematis]MCS3765677.1 penicillin-binding protein 1A [Bradyrhizobium centrosematis]MCS3777903.1 penicillin-binding protein 1A [Bradyrhizobium centrosematis]
MLTELMRGARLVGRSLRWGIVEPLSEALTFGVVGLILSFIVAIPAFRETASRDRGDGFDRTVFPAECRTSPTSACATHNTIALKELPEVLIKATLATQDHRFYSHFGIGLAAIARSLHARPETEGVHPPISQQVARMLFPSNGRTFEDRIHERLIAIWLEFRLTKDQILQIYLNRVRIGAGIFGVSDAARLYFQKRVQDIDLSEAAMLAGLVNVPPDQVSHIAVWTARQRATLVLEKLVETGFMTDDQVFGAKHYPARLIYNPEEAPLKSPK